jgi:hypothetical protein
LVFSRSDVPVGSLPVIGTVCVSLSMEKPSRRARDEREGERDQ